MTEPLEVEVEVLRKNRRGINDLFKANQPHRKCSLKSRNANILVFELHRLLSSLSGYDYEVAACANMK